MILNPGQSAKIDVEYNGSLSAPPVATIGNPAVLQQAGPVYQWPGNPNRYSVTVKALAVGVSGVSIVGQGVTPISFSESFTVVIPVPAATATAVTGSVWPV